MKKNVDFIKSFVFDLVMVKNQIMSDSFHRLVILIARIWPESLNWPFYFDESINLNFSEDIEILDKKNPILCTIIYIVKSHLRSMQKKAENDPAKKAQTINETEYMVYVSRDMMV